MGRTWRRGSLTLLILFTLVVPSYFMPQIPLGVRSAVYTLYRSRAQQETLGKLLGLEQLPGQHFVVYYPAGEREAATLVLAEAEAVYQPVRDALGQDFPTPVPVIMHASRRELQRSFGWGEGQFASGVYWAGIIRLVNPHAWLPRPSAEDRERLYRRWSPMAHELTHYALDYRTGGNYPRWFTEGLAQRVETLVTGLRLSHLSALPSDLYSFSELDGGFDRLADQDLAYFQSRRAVDHLFMVCGESGVRNLIDGLARHLPFSRALRGACGMTLTELVAAWRTAEFPAAERE